MTFTLLRAIPLLAITLFIAACSPRAELEAPNPHAEAYAEIQDGEFLIPAVDPKYLVGANPRVEVEYTGSESPGSIVVDTFARRLYYVLEDGRAMRYAIAVGREGLTFRGSGVIGRKAEWPNWTPTANMIRTQPETYAEFAAGLPGGLENPLGARALYLFRNGKDTHFRIHGTIDNTSIGRATSAGCIRLFNQDAMDLFDRVKPGARVKVRNQEESLELEGAFTDDEFGRITPVVAG